MKNLTEKNVTSLVQDCQDISAAESVVRVKGVKNVYKFDKTKIKANKEKIISMLSELPREFILKEAGTEVSGGWTFKEANVKSDGTQWTSNDEYIDMLVCLGLASKRIKFLFPRAMWEILPDKVPYLVASLFRDIHGIHNYKPRFTQDGNYDFSDLTDIELVAIRNIKLNKLDFFRKKGQPDDLELVHLTDALDVELAERHKVKVKTVELKDIF